MYLLSIEDQCKPITVLPCVMFQVFLTEYAGPLFIYLLFYTRPAWIYGELAASPKAAVVKSVYHSFVI